MLLTSLYFGTRIFQKYLIYLRYKILDLVLLGTIFPLHYHICPSVIVSVGRLLLGDSCKSDDDRQEVVVIIGILAAAVRHVDSYFMCVTEQN